MARESGSVIADKLLGGYIAPMKFDLKKTKEVTKNLEWKNIDHEVYRKYTFWMDAGIINVRIDNPILLNVSKSGGHRILDAKDVAHYIPSGWIHLYWETKDNIAFRF